jgi:simple sugar transport system permease protein
MLNEASELPESTVRKASALSSWITRFLSAKEGGIIIATITIASFFCVDISAFATYGNFVALMRLASRVGLISIGMTLLIISREFDLSVGSVYAFVPMLAVLMVDKGFDVWLVFVLAMGIAALFGLCNGLITAVIGVPSIITTLGTMFAIRSMALVISNGTPRMFHQTELFRNSFGGQTLGGFATGIVWFILVALLGYVVLGKTTHGNWTIATGSNESAARALGVSTKKTKIINFVIVSMLAGLSGINEASQLNSVSPTQGTGLELESIGAVVIGGTSLFGGSGTVIGTCVGSTLLGIISDGLSMLGVPAYWFQGLVGLLIVAVVLLNLRLTRSPRTK